MIEIIPAGDDLIALKVEGSISGADLDIVMDRLDAALARAEKVHVFVECHAISGLELQGIPNYASRAMPLFGKLNRFGRVAVVADQAWLRLATRLESAILPFISYRVYEPERRDEAFAWASGQLPD